MWCWVRTQELEQYLEKKRLKLAVPVKVILKVEEE